MTAASWHPSLDDFIGGFLVTDVKCNVVYANRYLKTKFGYDVDSICNKHLALLLSPASTIMFESYVIPSLLHERKCEDIQLVMLNSSGEGVPVIVNAVSKGEREICWSVYSSVQRDKLYQEFVDARHQLEEKAAKLKRLSITDELTGLLNRRELLRLSDKIIAAARRSQRPVSMLMLDIDHFKEINDSQGHAIGDRVLTQLGRLFHKQGRNSDVIARFGGEEFVFLLPDTCVEGAAVFAQRLHGLVTEVQANESPISVSIGIATETIDVDFDRLLMRADNALYEAKNTGRSKTTVAE